ncbi:unnamed protein product [Cladocopium goreaui]|uniref:Plastid lipid-associated protein/fibrillin conserved domain-containing protein n=1 Tax=Cladocopium goreaui TaxID=2562237 RepID=A0A9P1BKN9_9DINO|nr:unnamed protein product [Cladocopium goreaui]|mmetsp:Transcript_68232/g.149949  ORF Transcript_68232/g.149949 Transcript_68232/m.149949 type:complete len:274 (-) Transcript_68232:74-895(-)
MALQPRHSALAMVAVVAGFHTFGGFLGSLFASPLRFDFQSDFPTRQQASSPFIGRLGSAKGASRVSMKAGAEEESLQSAIKGGNSDRITKAIEALPAAPKTAMSMIEGDWQVTWDSNSLGPTKKTLLKLVCDQLPNTMVEFYRQYNLIQDGKYYWLMAFTMDGIQRTNAALMMSGSWTAGKSGAKGTVDFNEVQIVPSRHGNAESREAIRTTGLDRYMKPLKLKGDGKIEVTIHYVSDETLVQEDEVGNTYVFKKMSDSYPVPYIFADKKAES